MCPTKILPQYTLELSGMKQELRWVRVGWQYTHDKVTETTYRAFLKSHELAMRTIKNFYTTSHHMW